LTELFWPHYGPGLTQPLIGMSTRNISWGGKGGQCIGLMPEGHGFYSQWCHWNFSLT